MHSSIKNFTGKGVMELQPIISASHGRLASVPLSPPPPATCQWISSQHRDQVDPRQSFRTHLEGNQSLARHTTGRPLRLYVHAQARLLAQPHRGLLLQVCPFRLRHIRVASKHELKERIMAGIDDVNRHPVIHTWSYKLAEVA